MRRLHKSWARVYVGACVAAAALVGCVASEPGEPGAEVVAAALPGAAISAVNLSEVVAKLVEAGFPEARVQEMIDLLSMVVVPFGADHAYLAGFFRSATRSLGLSLGDRSCLALAQRRNVPVLTTDRAWQHSPLSVVVQLIR